MNSDITVYEMIDRWDNLRKMIEDTILAIYKSAENPNNEFTIISTGTLGRVLNMMKELEGEDE